MRLVIAIIFTISYPTCAHVIIVNYYHDKNFALRIPLKMRLRGTQKSSDYPPFSISAMFYVYTTATLKSDPSLNGRPLPKAPNSSQYCHDDILVFTIFCEDLLTAYYC